MALTNNEVKNAKPREKAYKLSDGNGFFLLIAPNGSKYWRFKYRFNDEDECVVRSRNGGMGFVFKLKQLRNKYNTCLNNYLTLLRAMTVFIARLYWQKSQFSLCEGISSE